MKIAAPRLATMTVLTPGAAGATVVVAGGSALLSAVLAAAVER